MTSLATQRREFSLFSRFAQDCMVFHDNLVCPMKLLYRAHTEWADENGFDALSAQTFVECLRETGIHIQSGGQGRLKRAAIGVGVRPKTVPVASV